LNLPNAAQHSPQIGLKIRVITGWRTTMERQGQAAIVTGVASGLGGATAEMLAKAGAQVAIIDNPMLNGETIRLDSAIRIAPK
jgi:hypothetical protein